MNKELQLEKIRKLIIKKYSDEILGACNNYKQNCSSKSELLVIDEERHFSLKIFLSNGLSKLKITVYDILDIVFTLQIDSGPISLGNGNYFTIRFNNTFDLLNPFVNFSLELMCDDDLSKLEEVTLFDIIDWLRQVD